MQAARGRGFDRWLEETALGRFYAWLTSVPGSLVFNTPVYKLHEELQLHAENRLLDIGCGRAAMLQLLASRVAFTRPPVGIDVSRVMLGKAGRPLRAELLQASGTGLPLADESFDVVTCAYAGHVLDEDGLLLLLRDVRRVLTPGGILLFWDFSPTRSRTLNRFHTALLGLSSRPANLRNYTTLSAYALEAGFEWISNAHLRPFLFPPIPRASIIAGKAPLGWQPDGGDG